jgi:uncharacterized protein (TIGR04255 family)
METDEVYPRAPLVLVALEVRHPVTEKLDESQRRVVKDVLTHELPIARSAQQVQFQIGVAAQQPVSEEFPKYFNRENTIAVSMRSNSVVVEATSYPGWDSFRGLVELALAARLSVGPLDGVERIGLRYINEIRVPNGDSSWPDWIHPSLLPPVAPGSESYSLTVSQNTAVFTTSNELAMVLQYGKREGFAIGQSDLRRVLPVTNNEFFLLDMDSYWTPSTAIPEFKADEILNICNRLHEPVDGLFDSLITEKLKDEVLRVATS